MKRKIVNLVGLMSFAIIGLAQAQDNWKGPADAAAESKAREYNAAYNDLKKSEQFVGASKPLNWLLTNAPDLHEALYINGVDVYAGVADATTNEAHMKIYQDSVLTISHKRKDLYDNENKWIE